jgi:hypothetical protein
MILRVAIISQNLYYYISHLLGKTGLSNGMQKFMGEKQLHKNVYGLA